MKQLLIVIVFICCIPHLVAQKAEKLKIDSLNAQLIQNSNLSTDSLLSIYQQNLKDAERIDYPKGVADAFSQLSLVYTYKANYDLATKYMLDAINAYEEIGDLKKVANTYAELGYGMKRRDLEKAQYYMQKGLKMAKSKHFDTILSRIYNNYGVIKEFKNQLDSAKFFYKKGLQLVQEINYTEGLPYSYSNLGGIYGQLKLYDSARYFFVKAKGIRTKLQDKKGIAENYTQIGEVYLAEENYPAAISSFKSALPLAMAEDYRFLVQYNYKQLSDAFKFQQKTDSALHYLELHNAYQDSINNLDIQKKIAALNIEFETEKKQNEILKQKAEIISKELEVKNKNFIILCVLGISILILLAGAFAINKHRTEKRQLEKEKELEIALAKIETQNKLQEQRIRISRDLHDNIGSQLTFIISSLDNLKFRLKTENPFIAKKIADIAVFTSRTISELRDTIWAMNKEKISMEELQSRILDYLSHARNLNESIDYKQDLKINDPDYRFSALEAVNIFRIIQEAINNATKYSGAATVELKIEENEEDFLFQVKDNGSGFETTMKTTGNGLGNMKNRASGIGSTLNITSSEKGSSVTLNFKK
ncbi:tetratricopeptide repeat-containing sensor histidine kinase [Zunongwangia atlantica]|uniref:histidine kinase n=1 Tax=Zunongwangia atlantica 22II14-10F7 TaxID=1185767 RepID=A0A1Y1T7K1_9FLAO|nr:tetratricopeptide repeat protein [Zunongwangia atlantica]ORL47029.1 two-component system sensor histidine kinase [Zunongwangia atlantica 22II14-10F7]